jgi:hypothetical protein
MYKGEELQKRLLPCEKDSIHASDGYISAGALAKDGWDWWMIVVYLDILRVLLYPIVLSCHHLE